MHSLNSMSRGLPKSTLQYTNTATDQHLAEAQEYADYNLSVNGAEMKAFRKQLPTDAKKAEILDRIDRHQVVIISGETGSGKTTQVPQYILDDWISKKKGSACQIWVTQPRRISALMVASRVAYERGEAFDISLTDAKTVGYQIRHVNQSPRKWASIKFMTTGILLNELKERPLLDNVSHVILDEVHERDLFTDFCIGILKDVIARRSDIRVVLMSASLDSGEFATYFDNCPVVQVPGRSHSVTRLYLEDVLTLTNFDKTGGSTSSPIRPFHQLLVQLAPSYSTRYDPAMRDVLLKYEGEVENICLPLVATLIRRIHETNTNKERDAILVFLPGWNDISQLYDMLNCEELTENEDNIYWLGDDVLLLFLHSQVTMEEQEMAFMPAPRGRRKIILSTNIAETSVTVDDVVYVVDTGRINMTNYDPVRNMTSLTSTWVSLSSATQRAGRAGRNRPGTSYHLFSRAKEDMLTPFVKPEIARSRLEEIVLKVVALELGDAERFLRSLVTKPETASVRNAVQLLVEIGAITTQGVKEELTPMGSILTELPVHPQLGKMAVMACMLGCLDPILSIVATLSDKDPFVIQKKEKRGLLAQIRTRFAQGCESDHIMMARVFKHWEVQELRNQGQVFCNDNCLSQQTMKTGQKLKNLLATILHRRNLIYSDKPHGKTNNANANNDNIMRAVIYAGLQPNCAPIAVQNGRQGKRFSALIVNKERVFIHRKSVNADTGSFAHGNVMVWYEKKQNNRGTTHVYDCTVVGQKAVDMFGKKNIFAISSPRERFDIFVENRLKQPSYIDGGQVIAEVITYLSN